ncbi:hypothetical protein L596_003170 [Steinernema carpocapsae]|uniref:Exonuclease domain-containing protein n=1 Tax=Steinernema carpocapsae TaxID=34508 RepID=A0A4U8USE4_STECR|nr:hypothetical protein L596_003170 [Steinernema carpocapsae]
MICYEILSVRGSRVLLITFDVRSTKRFRWCGQMDSDSAGDEASYSGYFADQGSTSNPWQDTDKGENGGGYYASYAPQDLDVGYQPASSFSMEWSWNPATDSSTGATSAGGYVANYSLTEDSSSKYEPEAYSPTETMKSIGGGYFSNTIPANGTAEEYDPEENSPASSSVYDPKKSATKAAFGANYAVSCEEYDPEEFGTTDLGGDSSQNSYVPSTLRPKADSRSNCDEYDPLSSGTQVAPTSYNALEDAAIYKPARLPEKRGAESDGSMGQPSVKKRCSSPDPEFSVLNKPKVPVEIGGDELLVAARRFSVSSSAIHSDSLKCGKKKDQSATASGSVLAVKKKEIGSMSREKRTQMANDCIKQVAKINQQIQRLEKKPSSCSSSDSEVKKEKVKSMKTLVAEKPKKERELSERDSSRPRVPEIHQRRTMSSSSVDSLFNLSAPPVSDVRKEAKPVRSAENPTRVDKGRKLTTEQLEAARKLMTKAQPAGKPAVNVKQGITKAKDQMTKRLAESSKTSNLAKTKSAFPSGSSSSSFNPAEGGLKGKRMAHQPSSDMKRLVPLPVSNTSVPGAIRLKYLKTLLEECLKISRSPDEALEMAQNEERSLCLKASTKGGYVSAGCNIVKNLRSMSVKNAHGESSSKSGISHGSVLAGQQALDISIGVQRSVREVEKSQKITELDFYEVLVENFLLNDQQFDDNAYPMWDKGCETPKVRFGGQESNTKGKRFLPMDELKRTCSRCGKEYKLTSRGGYVQADDCVYHYNRAFRSKKNGSFESRYNCCGSDLSVKGCCVSECHVTESLRECELSEFVETPAESGENDPRSHKVYAVDCEMVYTVWGPALARVSVVDINDDLVLDLLVKPKDLIVDCNTRFSGLTLDQLENCPNTISDAHERLFELINQKTVLIGHSLESDLKALRLVHFQVVDTSIVYPHRLGPPYKRALRTLASEVLSKIIQEEVSGHDSKEDSSACMQLMLHKVKNT